MRDRAPESVPDPPDRPGEAWPPRLAAFPATRPPGSRPAPSRQSTPTPSSARRLVTEVLVRLLPGGLEPFGAADGDPVSLSGEVEQHPDEGQHDGEQTPPGL